MNHECVMTGCVHEGFPQGELLFHFADSRLALRPRNKNKRDIIKFSYGAAFFLVSTLHRELVLSDTSSFPQEEFLPLPEF